MEVKKHRAKKSLGQHFLTSEKALRQMVSAAQVAPGDIVLEIGPGKGALTAHLLAAGACVVAVEMDVDMLDILEQEFKTHIADGTLRLVHGDILNLAVQKSVTYHLSSIHASYKLVANIPYYITGEIIRTFLTAEKVAAPTSMTLLVQKEVAERVARSEKESVLSLSVKAYGTPHYVATVPAGAFSPPPKVDSAILHVASISKEKFARHSVEEKTFFAVVKTGFGARRKMLLPQLAARYGKDAVLAIFHTLGIPTTARGEDVHSDAWFALTAALAPLLATARVEHK